MTYYADEFSQALVDEARKSLGTPFHHQGRLPGVGLDCAGLVIVAGRAAGHDAIDHTHYARTPAGAEMLATLHAQAEPVPMGQQKVGDLMLFKFVGNPQHIAILTGFNERGEMRIIHAYQPRGAVVEHDVSPALARHLFGVFRFVKKEVK